MVRTRTSWNIFYFSETPERRWEKKYNGRAKVDYLLFHINYAHVKFLTNYTKAVGLKTRKQFCPDDVSSARERPDKLLFMTFQCEAKK